MKNSNKTDTNSANMVHLISENDVISFVGEDVASLLLSPSIIWAKFVLTDDLPNGNNRRIPVEEFDNIIKSGLHTPVKMAEGAIKDGHEESKPLGTIAFLKKELSDAGNKIIALAALWAKERPEDVNILREAMDTEDGVNVSWELSFGDVQASEGGVIDYRDVVLNAATIVARPAYRGRTRFLALAAKAKDWSKAYIDDLPDTSFLYVERGGEIDSEGKTYPRNLRHFPIKDSSGLIVESRLGKALEETANTSLPENVLKGVRKNIKSLRERLDAGASLEELSFGEGYQKENLDTEDTKLKTLEELEKQLGDKEQELQDALAQLREKEEALTKATESFASLEGEKAALETEVTELREFKSGIEDEAKKAERLEAIRAKFAEAGVEKEEAYFSDNKETLLKLEDEDLEFMIQEFAAFAKNAEASTRIPNLSAGNAGGEVSVKDIAKALKERKAK